MKQTTVLSTFQKVKYPAQIDNIRLNMPIKKKQKVSVGDTDASAINLGEQDTTPAPAQASSPAPKIWTFDEVVRLSQASKDALVSSGEFNIGSTVKALYAARQACSTFRECGVG